MWGIQYSLPSCHCNFWNLHERKFDWFSPVWKNYVLAFLKSFIDISKIDSTRDSWREPGNNHEPLSREIALTVGQRFGTCSDIIPDLFFILMTRASTSHDVRHEWPWFVKHIRIRPNLCIPRSTETYSREVRVYLRNLLARICIAVYLLTPIMWCFSFSEGLTILHQ